MADIEANKHLRKDEDYVLDDRMTEETKEYAKIMIKQMNMNPLKNTPAHVIRESRIDANKKLNESFRFDDLLPFREILIENAVDKYQIPARVYEPKEVRPNSPIVVFYHGGGWTLCSLDTHHHACASLASASKTVWISVEYRLAPEHKFNTQLTDYRSSFEWIASNRAQFGVAADAKIGVAGDSAGGHIAALLAHEYKSKIDFQILVYPCVYLNAHYPSNDEFKSECFIITPDSIDYFMKTYLESADMAESELVSPLLKQDFEKLPPCLIIIANLDPLNGQILDYHKKLIQNGNKSDLKMIKGTIHGFFSSGYILKQAFEEAKNHILKFLEKQVKN